MGKSGELVRTPARSAKGDRSGGLRRFLWDNPELRRAFREAKEREEARRSKKK